MDDTHDSGDAADSAADVVRTWALLAARTADDKQGRGTVVLEVGSVLAITDYFVVTSGRNARQVRTIAEEVERAIKEAGGPGPLRVEDASGQKLEIDASAPYDWAAFQLLGDWR